MEPTEILENLCAYDKRNPDNCLVEEVVEESDRKEPCYCDNCFYGRTELAEEIIKLKIFNNY